jgi:hypothetical protein
MIQSKTWVRKKDGDGDAPADSGNAEG